MNQLVIDSELEGLPRGCENKVDRGVSIAGSSDVDRLACLVLLVRRSDASAGILQGFSTQANARLLPALYGGPRHGFVFGAQNELHFIPFDVRVLERYRSARYQSPVHRVTVEQMAILEPAMAETVVLTCMAVMRESLDEAIRRGVPAASARDFIKGHMHVNLGILFGFIDAEVSDGAKLAMKRGMEQIFQADWKKVFEPESVRRQVRAITEG